MRYIEWWSSLVFRYSYPLVIMVNVMFIPMSFYSGQSVSDGVSRRSWYATIYKQVCCLSTTMPFFWLSRHRKCIALFVHWCRSCDCVRRMIEDSPSRSVFSSKNGTHHIEEGKGINRGSKSHIDKRSGINHPSICHRWFSKCDRCWDG